MPTRPAGPIAQDWEPVVLHKSKPKAQVLRDQKSVNQALRAGAQVQTVKKFDGGTNKKSPATAVYARKLDEAEQPAALDRVAPEVRQMIQKAMIDKKLSQADLTKQINERPQVVQEYENGKAVPNQAVLGFDGGSWWLAICIVYRESNHLKNLLLCYRSLRLVEEELLEIVVAGGLDCRRL